MSFPPYASYKDSGVEWLGEVPSHWTVEKLKNVATFSGGGTPDRAREEFWGGNIPWVSPKDVKSERICDSEERITQEGLEWSTSNLVPPGAVLMVVRSGILKHSIPVALNEAPVALNQDLKAIRFETLHTARFFQRWVQGHVRPLLLDWAKQGATVESIEQEYLCNTLLPLPGEDEQRAIADFLDRETTKIDALVEAQRRLIALLKEKRQAVISHAVTKGLDPSAPLKPSGIPWLGDVPAHWEVLAIKRLTPVLRGASPRPIEDPAYFDANGQFSWVRISDVTNCRGNLHATEQKLSELGSSLSVKLCPGSLFLSIAGSVGKPCITNIPICIHDGLRLLSSDRYYFSFSIPGF